MDSIFICDIDGTLADNSHRSPFDESKVLLDKPLPTCFLIKNLYFGSHKIIFFSGRTDRCYDDTKKWIEKNTSINSFDISLFMRKYGDNRGDEIIKRELYDTRIKDKYNVIGVFDDRLKVCRMWYDLGLFVFNCNQGLKEF